MLAEKKPIQSDNLLSEIYAQLTLVGGVPNPNSRIKESNGSIAWETLAILVFAPNGIDSYLQPNGIDTYYGYQ